MQDALQSDDADVALAQYTAARPPFLYMGVIPNEFDELALQDVDAVSEAVVIVVAPQHAAVVDIYPRHLSTTHMLEGTCNLYTSYLVIAIRDDDEIADGVVVANVLPQEVAVLPHGSGMSTPFFKTTSASCT